MSSKIIKTSIVCSLALTAIVVVLGIKANNMRKSIGAAASARNGEVVVAEPISQDPIPPDADSGEEGTEPVPSSVIDHPFVEGDNATADSTANTPQEANNSTGGTLERR